MEFECSQAAYLFLALPFFVLLYLYSQKKKAQSLFLFYGKNLPASFSNHFPFVFFLLAWCSLTVALMQPYKGGMGPFLTEEKKSPYPPSQCLLLIDASRSMTVKDTQEGTRLESAKKIATAFWQGLQSKKIAPRLSLYAFTGELSAIVPPTRDLLFLDLALTQLIDRVADDSSDGGGTDFLAVFTALSQRLASQPADEKLLVFCLSDGEDNAEDNAEDHFEEKAKEQTGESNDFSFNSSLMAALNLPGLAKFFAIGIGSKEGGLVEGVSFNGQPVISRLQAQKLQALAQGKGGRFYLASNLTAEALAQELIAQVEGELVEKKSASIANASSSPLFLVFVFLTLVFLFLERFCRERTAKLPWRLNFFVLFLLSLFIPTELLQASSNSDQSVGSFLVQEEFSLAKELFEKGQFYAAQAIYEKMLELNLSKQERLEASYNRAICFLQAGNFNQALALFARLQEEELPLKVSIEINFARLIAYIRLAKLDLQASPFSLQSKEALLAALKAKIALAQECFLALEAAAAPQIIEAKRALLALQAQSEDMAALLAWQFDRQNATPQKIIAVLAKGWQAANLGPPLSQSQLVAVFSLFNEQRPLWQALWQHPHLGSITYSQCLKAPPIDLQTWLQNTHQIYAARLQALLFSPIIEPDLDLSRLLDPLALIDDILQGKTMENYLQERYQLAGHLSAASSVLERKLKGLIEVALSQNQRQIAALSLLKQQESLSENDSELANYRDYLVENALLQHLLQQLIPFAADKEQALSEYKAVLSLPFSIEELLIALLENKKSPPLINRSMNDLMNKWLAFPKEGQPDLRVSAFSCAISSLCLRLNAMANLNLASWPSLQRQVDLAKKTEPILRLALDSSPDAVSNAPEFIEKALLAWSFPVYLGYQLQKIKDLLREVGEAAKQLSKESLFTELENKANHLLKLAQNGGSGQEKGLRLLAFCLSQAKNNFHLNPTTQDLMVRGAVATIDLMVRQMKNSNESNEGKEPQKVGEIQGMGKWLQALIASEQAALSLSEPFLQEPSPPPTHLTLFALYEELIEQLAAPFEKILKQTLLLGQEKGKMPFLPELLKIEPWDKVIPLVLQGRRAVKKGKELFPSSLTEAILQQKMALKAFQEALAQLQRETNSSKSSSPPPSSSAPPPSTNLPNSPLESLKQMLLDQPLKKEGKLSLKPSLKPW